MPLPPAPTALRTLALQYAALEPLHALSFPPALDLARAQPFLVAYTLDEPTLVQYPPAASYRRAFLKALVDRLEQGVRESDEEEELEVDEAILSFYLDAMALSASAPVDAPPGPSYKTFFFPSPSSPIHDTSSWDDAERMQHITLLEERKTIQAGTTGLRTWGASLRLAEYLLEDSSRLGETGDVLELGAGVGFLGTFIGRLLSSSRSFTSSSGQEKSLQRNVILTDFDSRVLEGLESNLRLNDLDPAMVRSERLDWMEPLPEDLVPSLILAADVVYDPSLVPPLVETLSTLLHRQWPPSSAGQSRPEALVASTIRNATTFALFRSSAEAAGLETTELALPSGPRVFWGCGEGRKAREGEREEVVLLRLRAKTG